MAFDITSVLRTVSGPDTGKEQIQYIDLDLLDQDDRNFYSLDRLDELAGNIELIGLQQPLRVRPGKAGRYVVVSGHRRRAACLMIRDGGSEQFRDGVPCIVEYGEASEAMQELRMIYANSSTRVMSASEISKQAERVTQLLYELKEQGVEFPGRMRDHVAEACQVSRTKLARLHAIRKNLTPELLEEFDGGRLNETVAYRISQEDPAVQKELFDRCGESQRYYTESRISESVDRIKNPPPLQKPEADRDPGWDLDAYLANRKKEDEDFAEMLDEIMDRMFENLVTIESRQEGIETLKQTFRNAGGDYAGLQWAGDGNGLVLKRPDRAQIRRTWTEVFDMAALDALYRCGLQARGELPEPEAAADTEGAEDQDWRDGTPKRAGRYLCMVDLGTTKLHEQRCEYDGEQWTAYGRPIDDMFRVVYWYPLPKRREVWAIPTEEDEEE